MPRQPVSGICAAKVASNEIKKENISQAKLSQYLGKRKIYKESVSRRPNVGTAVGLAWTPVGGEILRIEATRMPGNGRFHVTGKLGEVMKPVQVQIVKDGRWHHYAVIDDPVLLVPP